MVNTERLVVAPISSLVTFEWGFRVGHESLFPKAKFPDIPLEELQVVIGNNRYIVGGLALKLFCTHRGGGGPQALQQLRSDYWYCTTGIPSKDLQLIPGLDNNGTLNQPYPLELGPVIQVADLHQPPIL